MDSADGTRGRPGDFLAGPWTVTGPADGAAPYRTERERILDTLRDRVLSGVLAAGTRVGLDALAAEFGTSRTPVREACLALSQEGLMRVAQRSGITVVGLTPEAVLENFALMAALSGLAAQWAARDITERERLRIRELNREIKVAAGSGDDIAALNWAFHREINRACRSPKLQAMLGDVGRMIPRRFFELFPEHVPCSLGEHDELVAALDHGDGVTARRVAEGHFESASRVLRQHFEAKGRDGDS
ncbi:GntR family transcriptional regulator [Streptomyces sp. NBC_01239]|uniref:GntR family transcriptional regulator n=1 Tax=Streptomyces sp. NBC_01239 TaxID=2903792 RepID=UPI00224F770D|nr:GntR family transcriptional regulator [Streptomyces sp. NBC_01239]MCX4815252.1 GntR family transcriptional regulator [Streptomyces sp. NBC_01239]